MNITVGLPGKRQALLYIPMTSGPYLWLLFIDFPNNENNLQWQNSVFDPLSQHADLLIQPVCCPM